MPCNNANCRLAYIPPQKQQTAKQIQSISLIQAITILSLLVFFYPERQKTAHMKFLFLKLVHLVVAVKYVH